MKVVGRLVSCLIAIGMVSGCASTKVSDREVLVTEKIPRPDRILVHDFVATPADVPPDSALVAAEMANSQQTPEHIATGRRVGADMATQLVQEIRGMGLPAERATTQSMPKINDIVIRGYLLSVDEGSTAKRVAIGFGAGASQLSVAVEGYQMTAQGLRKLGSGRGTVGGDKTPGGGVPLGVTLATGNPIGLVVMTPVKAYGELSGSTRIDGRAAQAVKEIAKELKLRFQKQGWIK
jgi:Domain of unknown function (DUF4410)